MVRVPVVPEPAAEYQPTRPEVFIDLSVFGFSDEPASEGQVDTPDSTDVAHETVGGVAPAKPALESSVTGTAESPGAEEVFLGGTDAGLTRQLVTESSAVALLPLEDPAGEDLDVEALESQPVPAAVRLEKPDSAELVAEPTAVVETAPSVENEPTEAPSPVAVRLEEPDSSEPVAEPTAVVEAVSAVENEPTEVSSPAAPTSEGETAGEAVGAVEPAAVSDGEVESVASYAGIPRRSEKARSIPFSALPGTEASAGILRRFR